MKQTGYSINQFVLTALVVSVVLLSCASTMPSYVGKTAVQEKRVALLNSGPHEDKWQTNDLTIDYSYVNQTDTLEINGRIELARSLSTGFTAVEGFRVRINFLDDEKKILDTQLIFVAGHRAPIRNWGFERRYQLPSGTEAFNFSYSGTVTDFSGSGGPARGGDGVTWDFWQNP